MKREQIERMKEQTPGTDWFLLVMVAGVLLACLCRGIS